MLSKLYSEIYYPNASSHDSIFDLKSANDLSPDYFMLMLMCGSILSSCTKSKIAEFKKNAENILMREEKIDIFTEYYSKLVRIRNAFKLLLKIRRWKNAPIYNTEDLLMNPVREGQKNTITILQNNYKYVFTIKELINHLNTNLTYSPGFFSEPIPCKNPYTNLPFAKSDLYNIYFAIRQSTFVIPLLIHQYFMAGFNLQKFLNENDAEIRDIYIVDYVNNLQSDNVHELVRKMLKHHNMDNKIKISACFPKDRLLEIMRPYLMDHYKSLYSQKHWTRAKSTIKLHSSLHELYCTNPTFGRKKVEFRRMFKGFVQKKHQTMLYEDSVPEIKISSISDFMKSHSQLHPQMTNRILQAYDRMTFPDDIESESDDDDDDDDDDNNDNDNDRNIRTFDIETTNRNIDQSDTEYDSDDSDDSHDSSGSV